jgi:gluconolactonase
MALDLSRVQFIASGLDHPEGVAWGPDNLLYASGEAGQVYRIDPNAGTCDQFASTGGFGLGLAHDADGNVFVCDMGVHAVVRVTPAGLATIYATGPADNRMQKPNYPVFDADGNLYVSDSRNWGQNDGLIYRCRPGGEAEIWSEQSPGYTNGLALSADGGWLYVVESTLPGVSRIAVGRDGQAGERQVVVRLPRTVPDGVALDAEGRLYIACYAPDRIYVCEPGGEPEILLDDWARMALNAPTNLAFAGPGLRQLAIAGLGGWAVTWVDAGTSGQPLNYPRL